MREARNKRLFLSLSYDKKTHQVLRGPESGIDHHGHERPVEAVLLGQASKSRVAHPLRHDERGDRGASEEIKEQVGFQGIGREPADAGEDGGGVVQGAVGCLDARGSVGCRFWIERGKRFLR